jgi:hypothetical protein
MDLPMVMRRVVATTTMDLHDANTMIVLLDRAALASSERMDRVRPTDREMIADPALGLEAIPRVVGTRAKVRPGLVDRRDNSGRMVLGLRIDPATIADPALVLEAMARGVGTRAKVRPGLVDLASSGRMDRDLRTDLGTIAGPTLEPTARDHPEAEGLVLRRVRSRLVVE